MRVFVTGASGHIGSALVPELRGGGHRVIALARSDDSARKLAAAGVDVRRGDPDDLDLLAETAASADGVIHLAFRHDLAFGGDAAGAAATDLKAIEAIGSALAGTGKPFVTTGGTLMLWAGGITGRPGTEEDVLAGFVTADNPTSSALTRQWLGWEPVHPGLIEDLNKGHYFA